MGKSAALDKASGDRSDARAVRTGEALRSALLTLLERKPFDQITVREIVAEAGIGYATYFRHHPTKEALLDHVARAEITSLVGHAMPVLDTTGRFTSSLTLCAFVDEHRALWSTLLTGGAGPALREQLMAISREVAVDRADQSEWLPPELGVSCAVSLILEIVTWWLKQPAGTYSIEQVAEIVDRLVLRPVMPAG